ncbi:MutS-related protein, partial [Frisingicoccus sp.]|uniref:MutS-related protein n=1 Tax=Frisingicoccus sp. TaxID=1918627 RepID=UPI00399A93F6
AWAVVEHISDKKKLGAKTLFATHYHELTELEGRLPGVNNYCIAVKEQGDDIIFLRKIIQGGADKSYGIQVARLAGIPSSVTDRAKEIVLQLIDADIASKAREIASEEVACLSGPEEKPQIVEEAASPEQMVIAQIAALDLARLTPLEAINLLYQYQDEIKKR